jgi:hypothetical protein
MREWTREELDGIIQDFTTQLCAAKVEGWDRSKPDRFRAIVAALQIALEERRRPQGRCTRLECPPEVAASLPGGESSARPVRASWRAFVRRTLSAAFRRRTIDPLSG